MVVYYGQFSFCSFLGIASCHNLPFLRMYHLVVLFPMLSLLAKTLKCSNRFYIVFASRYLLRLTQLSFLSMQPLPFILQPRISASVPRLLHPSIFFFLASPHVPLLLSSLLLLKLHLYSHIFLDLTSSEFTTIIYSDTHIQLTLPKWQKQSGLSKRSKCISPLNLSVVSH